MKKIVLGVFLSALIISCNNEKAKEEPAAAATTTSATTDELLPVSEGDAVKAAMAAFSKKDIDGMIANYDDNIRYYWGSGDSLIGKQAVKDYYLDRFKLIDSIDFSDQIVLPVKVNAPQSPYHTPGKWVIHWSFVHVKYMNGKKLNFWINNNYHYNDAGKVDVAIQIIDRAPILEATKDLVKK